MDVKYAEPVVKDTPERIDPLKRVFIPIEKKRADGTSTLRTIDGERYIRQQSGAIQRVISKVRGKAARRADKRGRRKMSEEMVLTTKGLMRANELRKVVCADGAVEYYIGEELVHRSVEVKLTGVSAQIHQAKIG